MAATAEPAAAPAKVWSGERIAEMQKAVRGVAVPADVLQYAVQLVTATRPSDPAAPESTRRLVLRGASLRAGQAMLQAGKVLAAVAGRTQLPRDVIGRRFIVGNQPHEFGRLGAADGGSSGAGRGTGVLQALRQRLNRLRRIAGGSQTDSRALDSSTISSLCQCEPARCLAR